MLKLGFIGFGEAGYYLSSEFKEGEVEGYAFDTAAFTDDPRAEGVRRRAAENHITLVQSLEELAAACEIVVCLTSAASALPIAKSIAPFMRANTVYADLNSASPKTKEQIAEAFRCSKGTFIEAAIMNAVPAKKTKVPILICGEGCEQVAARLNVTGMNVTALSGAKLGTASATKMLKSVLSKGVIALFTEAALVTEKYDLTETVFQSLWNTMNMMTYEKFCHYMVTQAAYHSERLGKEMGEVLATLDDLDENSIMTQAAKKKFEWLHEKGFADYFAERPETYQEVISAKHELKCGKE